MSSMASNASMNSSSSSLSARRQPDSSQHTDNINSIKSIFVPIELLFNNGARDSEGSGDKLNSKCINLNKILKELNTERGEQTQEMQEMEEEEESDFECKSSSYSSERGDDNFQLNHIDINNADEWDHLFNSGGVKHNIERRSFKISTTPHAGHSQLENSEFSVSMFGKKGWICDLCNNFNYESRIQCHKCEVNKTPKRIQRHTQTHKVLSSGKIDFHSSGCSSSNKSGENTKNVYAKYTNNWVDFAKLNEILHQTMLLSGNSHKSKDNNKENTKESYKESKFYNQKYNLMSSLKLSKNLLSGINSSSHNSSYFLTPLNQCNKMSFNFKGLSGISDVGYETYSSISSMSI